jgi:hypothetical protein
MGHDINVMHFSEVIQLKLVTFCDYKQMHSILYKNKFHALLVPYKPKFCIKGPKVCVGTTKQSLVGLALVAW